MKWMIIRQVDERSSDICAEIEKLAQRDGGLELPFTINGKTFGKEVLNKALNTSGQYYTNIFHEHCRSHLIPLSDESSILYPDRKIDDIDKKLLVNSAMSYNADLELEQEVGDENSGMDEESFTNYKLSKHNIQTKQSLNLFRGKVV